MYHKRLEGGIIDLKSNQIVYNTWHLWYSIFKLMYKVIGFSKFDSNLNHFF